MGLIHVLACSYFVSDPYLSPPFPLAHGTDKGDTETEKIDEAYPTHHLQFERQLPPIRVQSARGIPSKCGSRVIRSTLNCLRRRPCCRYLCPPKHPLLNEPIDEEHEALLQRFAVIQDFLDGCARTARL